MVALNQSSPTQRHACHPLSGPRSQVFHVGGLGLGAEADTITGEDYLAASADCLEKVAERIVKDFNTNRADEVGRIGAAAAGISVSKASLREIAEVDSR